MFDLNKQYHFLCVFGHGKWSSDTPDDTCPACANGQPSEPEWILARYDHEYTGMFEGFHGLYRGHIEDIVKYIINNELEQHSSFVIEFRPQIVLECIPAAPGLVTRDLVDNSEYTVIIFEVYTPVHVPRTAHTKE